MQTLTRTLLSALAAVCLPMAALSETRDERIAVAEAYVALAMAEFDMAALIETMYRPVVSQVEAAGQTVTPAQLTAIEALYAATFTGPMTALMQEQATIMADVMTLAEITALRDFYATPEGRSAMAKLPQLTEAQQPGVMKLFNDRMPALMPKVLEVINAGP